MVHESGHCFDAAWDTALQKDACVTNRYHSPPIQSFAESFFAINNSKEDVWNNQRLITQAALPYLYKSPQ
ncbi:hypothetical protein PROFUN_06851 [Planoprotostelium fungivorum]|uniref:Uncharacterized protein n=1 Tax=Planoprotostelium fungivorum TaxID=1890364 RepID=A0A2P6NNG4_9EUKA|nr:hypothetical protein PROFUN_06851 [Planoprotostelium fungivorum]